MNFGVAGRRKANAKCDVEIERRSSDSIAQTAALLMMAAVG
jgi:hypothetical protein